jgi:hypothetical protein
LRQVGEKAIHKPKFLSYTAQEYITAAVAPRWALRLKVEAQNVESQNVEKSFENVEFIRPVRIAPIMGKMPTAGLR